MVQSQRLSRASLLKSDSHADVLDVNEIKRLISAEVQAGIGTLSVKVAEDASKLRTEMLGLGRRVDSQLRQLERQLRDLVKVHEDEAGVHEAMAKSLVRQLKQVRDEAEVISNKHEEITKTSKDIEITMDEVRKVAKDADNVGHGVKAELDQVKAELRLGLAQFAKQFENLGHVGGLGGANDFQQFGIFGGGVMHGVSMNHACDDCGLLGKLYIDPADKRWHCAQCWYAHYGEWPHDPAQEVEAQMVLVLDRYEINMLEVLGQGGFSTVRRGRDTQTGEIVAVKTYSDMEFLDANNEEHKADLEYYLGKFKHEVDIFEKLHEKLDMKKGLLSQKEADKSHGKRASWFIPSKLGDEDNALLEIFDDFPDTTELFIRLVDYSRDETGQAGPAPDGLCYVVLELAEYTLDEFLHHRSCVGPQLSADEVWHITQQLTQMIAGLHAKGFVHADLKPLNIMHFPSGRWKLIDMDGMVTSGGVDASSVCYTPLYCAPEFAMMMLEGLEVIEMSRLIDVWSLGLSIIECLTLQPMLLETFQEFGDPGHFLWWLVEPEVPLELPPQVEMMDPQLADLCRRMLNKNPNLRMSMIEVLVHPYFTQHEHGEEAVSEKEIWEMGKWGGTRRASVTGGATAMHNGQVYVADGEHWHHDDMSHLPPLAEGSDEER